MKRVLIAEDDDIERALLAQALCHCPHEIVLVADGADALVAYGRAMRECRAFALLILDCSMPRVTGLEVARRLSDLGDNVTPIVFLTGHSKEIEVKDFDGLNVRDVWEKPDALIDLERRIQTILDDC